MKTSHIMCILKILTGLCLIKQRIKTKSAFVNVVCNVVSSEKGFIEYTENCLVINDKQTVKLGKCSISFKNYFKQLPAPFKIYAGFECISSATS